MKKGIYGLFFIAGLFLIACNAEHLQAVRLPQNNEAKGVKMKEYYFPAEDEEHEGTWLTWPHQYTYGKKYRNEIEDIWLEMVYALHADENVHIVAYDKTEKNRITKLLKEEDIDMNRVDFVIAKSDDVWARDTGPMFVFDENDRMVIADFAFDGWGKKTPYKYDDAIPKAVGSIKKIPIVSIPDFILEGGSVELDGKGTAMLCKSSVISKNRNSGMTQRQAEKYLSQYLGATNFIWLEGVLNEDITDAHIDGMARFYDDKTLLTVSEDDFLELYENIQPEDYKILRSARNADGKPYKVVTLPMTAKNVKGLDYKGSYLNYYVGNGVVLVPAYGDANDKPAAQILKKLYRDREIIPIDISALYAYGGMIHCVTQQQPMIP